MVYKVLALREVPYDYLRNRPLCLLGDSLVQVLSRGSLLLLIDPVKDTLLILCNFAIMLLVRALFRL